MSVLRALPNLEKLDDKIVTPEELQTSFIKGTVLVHPLSNDASKQAQYDHESPEVGKSSYQKWQINMIKQSVKFFVLA